MTGGSVMDWWGEGRGARPLVVRDMSSGARDRTCVWGDLSARQACHPWRSAASKAFFRTTNDNCVVLGQLF